MKFCRQAETRRFTEADQPSNVSSNRIRTKFGVDWNITLNRWQGSSVFTFHHDNMVYWPMYWTVWCTTYCRTTWMDQLKLGQIGPLDKPRRTSIPWCMSGWRKLSESWGTASQEKKISTTWQNISGGTKKAQQEKFLCRTSRMWSWIQYMDWWKGKAQTKCMAAHIITTQR